MPVHLFHFLVISHCWDEGVHEFGEAVSQSWPAECAGAYICSLANPQNLEISEMISRPQKSPFYKVLVEIPKHILMVANSVVPIHSRLWCCYEAYCAFQINEENAPEGKGALDLVREECAIPITIAGDPFNLLPQREDWEEVRRFLSEERRKDKALLSSLVQDVTTTQTTRQIQLMAMLRKRVGLDVRRAECTETRDKDAIMHQIQGDEVNVSDMIVKLMYDSLSNIS